MRTSRLLIASVLVLAVMLLSASPASAGVYYVYSCKTPNDQLASTDGWSVVQTLRSGSAVNNCARGGSLRLTLPGDVAQPPKGVVGWHYQAPPDTLIDRFWIWRSATVRHSSSERYTSPLAYISFPSQDFQPDAFEFCGIGCNAHGTTTESLVASNQKDSGNLAGIQGLYFTAACVGSVPCEPRAGDMVDYRVQALEVRLRDDLDPVVSNVGGSMLQPGIHRGTDQVSFAAQDRGGGLYRTKIELKRDGAAEYTTAVNQVVDANGGRCAEFDYQNDTDREFKFRQPCKLSASEDAQLDTTTVPDGDYLLRVRVEDAAGNSATVAPPVKVTIDNVAPSATAAQPGQASPAVSAGPSQPNGTNASDQARLSLSGPRRRTLRYGKRASATLRLRDEAGRAISGATVVVLRRMKVPGARWVAQRAATTDGKGKLKYKIRPKYSRVLRFAYRSRSGPVMVATKADLVINVRSKTTLRATPSFLHNGQTVHFKGKLKSRPVPRAGVVIDLQARVGRRWQTFNTLRTGSAGKWRARYRFRSTRGLQTYKFRARVRGDSSFPYSPSTSRRVKVRVRG